MVTYVCIGVFLALIAGGMWGCPRYNVWQQGLAGQAELRRAEQNRQIAIQEARARFESADLLNKAEVLRAEGLKAATSLVAESFGGPDAYLRYLWIQAMDEREGERVIVYLPTEAGLPILEAQRRLGGAD